MKREAEKVIYNVHTLLSDLKFCSVRRDLQWGKTLHSKAVEIQHESNIYVLTALIRMYAKCGSMLDARHLFDSVEKPDVVCWNVLISGYTENGDELTTLDLFLRMKACGYVPDSVTYIAALKACTALAGKRDGECLKRGREIHSEIHCDLGIFVQNTLINMYSKCGSMVDARLVFDSIQNPDVVSWNVLLLGYAENGSGLITLDLFSKMKAVRKCVPNSVTYVAAVKACTSLVVKRDGRVQGDSLKRSKCLEMGREIHSEIGHLDHYIQSALIDMYGKCGSMVDARRVFESIRNPSVVCWNALLQGYAENENGHATLDLFSKMKDCGCVPDSVTYVSALKACIALVGKRDGGGHRECLKRGRMIHSQCGYNLDVFVQSTLIDMYSKCDSMVDAHQVFESIKKPNVVCWNALLLGYVENGDGLAALELFSRMKAYGCAPDSVTYVAAFKACISLLKHDGGQVVCLKRGREIHSEMGSEMDIVVQNTLIDMYTKCCSMAEAHRVFDSIQKPDVVSWTALLLGYADSGDGHTTLELFSKMKACGCAPNSVTYIAALKACTSLTGKQDRGGQAECLKRGRDIHNEIGSEMDIFVQNTLIDMYANCGSMVDARCVFENIQKPNVVCWNSLLLGYAEIGDGLTTLELFSRMKACGYVADSVTYVAALKACGLIGALALGRKFHSDITEFTTHVVTCLVDFYAKCGSILQACEVFDLHITARVVPTWNALLAGYGSFGDAASVVKLFEAMQDQGFKPDSVTFVCMLSCFSHAGLLEKARECFEAMLVQHGVTPDVMHYNCMVDILGRANQLHEAIAMLQKMPCNPDVVTWTALLAACRKWKNVEIGKWAFQSLVDIDKKDASAYVLMAQIYGSQGMWDEQEMVLEMRKKFAALKLPGQAHAMNEVGNVVNFVVKEEDPSLKDKLKQLFEELGYAAM